ncbi:MAG: hypothetical protein JWR18_3806 [Segetibacter sp.]|jgi:hypothetical protein|nr:hypothetical protein [Segetibacter sp.]
MQKSCCHELPKAQVSDTTKDAQTITDENQNKIKSASVQAID